MKKLTPEQITNWRKILSSSIGPYALIMDDEEVQRFYDDMQNNINNREID
jgi:hypothetical protein